MKSTAGSISRRFRAPFSPPDTQGTLLPPDSQVSITPKLDRYLGTWLSRGLDMFAASLTEGAKVISKHWNILLVDDEPDILAVSRLALKRMTCYGLPLKLHECASKKEAVDFFDNNPEANFIAAAIIDVVMESDHAGLDLCKHIREGLRNYTTPIIIRTGQPGRAPEREVVDRYEITGYVAKVEATDLRLYSLLKCCVRQYFVAFNHSSISTALLMLAHATQSRSTFLAALKFAMTRLCTDKFGRNVESMEGNHCWILEDYQPEGGTVTGPAVVGSGVFENSVFALEKRDELAAMEGEGPISERDSLVGRDNFAMLTLGATESTPVVHFLFTVSTWPMHEFSVSLLHQFCQAIRAFWTTARANANW